MPKKLQTAAEVIDALGGTAEVSRMLGDKYGTVWMWRDRNDLPANTFYALDTLLRLHGYDPSPELWGMRKLHNKSARS